MRNITQAVAATLKIKELGQTVSAVFYKVGNKRYATYIKQDKEFDVVELNNEDEIAFVDSIFDQYEDSRK